MRTRVGDTAKLGELVVAAFDAAAHYSRDARQVSRLATQAVMEVLQRARSASTHSGRPKKRENPGS
jgi:hypothetical protein